jgi:hypothetical protein
MQGFAQMDNVRVPRRAKAMKASFAPPRYSDLIAIAVVDVPLGEKTTPERLAQQGAAGYQNRLSQNSFARACAIIADVTPAEQLQFMRTDQHGGNYLCGRLKTPPQVVSLEGVFQATFSASQP